MRERSAANNVEELCRLADVLACTAALPLVFDCSAEGSMRLTTIFTIATLSLAAFGGASGAQAAAVNQGATSVPDLARTLPAASFGEQADIVQARWHHHRHYGHHYGWRHHHHYRHYGWRHHRHWRHYGWYRGHHYGWRHRHWHGHRYGWY
jgi:hypothetical protein